MKILLATDGSRCSEAAAREIARRPWPPGSSLKIVSAVNVTLLNATSFDAPPAGLYNDCVASLSECARQAIARAKKIVAAGGRHLRVSDEVLIGPPAPIILDEAEKWGADLVVVGSHGKGAVKRLVMGSV